MEVVSGSCKLSEVGNGESNGPQFLLGERKVICCVSDGNRERERMTGILNPEISLGPSSAVGYE